jgi:hypothetical protein
MTPIDVALMLEERKEKVYESPNIAPPGFISLAGAGQKVFRLYGDSSETGIFYIVGDKANDGTQKVWGVGFNDRTTKEEIEAEILKGREFVN